MEPLVKTIDECRSFFMHLVPNLTTWIAAMVRNVRVLGLHDHDAPVCVPDHVLALELPTFMSTYTLASALQSSNTRDVRPFKGALCGADLDDGRPRFRTSKPSTSPKRTVTQESTSSHDRNHNERNKTRGPRKLYVRSVAYRKYGKYVDLWEIYPSRRVMAVRHPQATSVHAVSSFAAKFGGTATSASTVMRGGLLAGTTESPGKSHINRAGELVKADGGMGSIDDMEDKKAGGGGKNSKASNA
ncbi:hypothetical protein AYL99_11730 [Fonsecaea erecta]|uniref:IMP dehydrogenase/GMP reductase domain-containing protein n=1 Tax=Fonsecaea erecta TaxID=1367422 RepID=A0A178Z543_9EURO|nr:hypothetical protein AYL99_11730 [Fonsecaea erecta]OAP54195.1 hypothetical protein AYL99_11730 [Fonsecaea erecta]